MRLGHPTTVFTCVQVALLLVMSDVVAAASPSIEFNRDVRPILADRCFQCHGPDAKQRQGDLRLDTADAASAERKGGPVVVAGQPERSELWRRINSSDADERMPPPDKGGKLTAAEIATLKQWIIEGARLEKHWSLLPVKRSGAAHPEPRSASEGIQNSRIRNSECNRCVRGEHAEQSRLSPSSEADRPTLLRRVTLDLTGLPPTPEEIEASSTGHGRPMPTNALSIGCWPRRGIGERMAVPLARRGPLCRHQRLSERRRARHVAVARLGDRRVQRATCRSTSSPSSNWPATCCRSATLDQRIATGFNRNHRGNAEGGIIPEEYAVEYVADRVETTATVWLGLTIGCCPLPRPQVRPVHAARLLQPLRVLQQRARKRPGDQIRQFAAVMIPAPTRLQAATGAVVRSSHVNAS